MTSKFDKLDEKLREQYEEAFFQELMDGYDEYQGAKLKREAEAENNGGPSPELIAQMKGKIAKEISRQKRMKAIGKMRRFGKYVAIFFVAVVAVFSVSFVTVDAFRTRLLNYFFANHGEATVHIIQQSQSGIFAPSYIPSGMSIALYSDESEPIEMLIQNADSTFYVHIFIFDDQTQVYSDTEDITDMEDIDINGVSAEYSEKDGYASIVWSNLSQTYLAHMDSNLPKEEMIKIATSVNLS